MTTAFTAEDLRSALRSIVADVSRVSVPLPALSLFDACSGAGAGRDVDELMRSTRADTPPDPWGRFGTHTFRLTASSLEELLVAVAAAVQDDVMDELGRPWPEVTGSGGAFSGVLTPSMDEAGRAVWSDGKGTVVRVGNLGSLATQIRW